MRPTLRQIHYELVALGGYRNNTKSYRPLHDLVTHAAKRSSSARQLFYRLVALGLPKSKRTYRVAATLAAKPVRTRTRTTRGGAR
jgi:hypothetical protein